LSHLGFFTIKDLRDFLQSRSTRLDVKEVHEDKFKRDPTLMIINRQRKSINLLEENNKKKLTV
jgi:hypothetical protein